MRNQKSIILRFLLFFLLISVLGALMTTVEATSTSKKPKLIFGDDINYPPFSYLNERGQPSGFNVELVKAIGNAMGYEVEVRLGEWSSIREALKNGEIDAIAGMVYSDDRTQYVDFSSRYLIASGDIFMKSGETLSDIKNLKNQTVIVQKGDFVGEYLKSLDLNIQLVEVPTVADALLAIKDGKYKYAGLAKLPGLYTQEKDKLTGISAQGLNLVTSDYGMAVNKGDERLLLILNSGMQVLKATGEYDKIYQRCLGVYADVSFADLVHKYRLAIVSFLILVLVLIGTSVLMNQLVRTRTKELQESNKALYNKKIELETLITNMKSLEENFRYLSFHDQLTGLYNRHFLEAQLNLLDTQDNLPFTIVMADVNGLKLTNDAFGHKAGDVLLKKVADILKKECKTSDVAARFGGDEFVMLLPKTTSCQTEKIINRIYESIEAEKQDNIIISVSFGYDTKTTLDQSIDEVLTIAEEHMYRKKLVESQSMRNQTIKVIMQTLLQTNIREKIHSEKVSQISRSIGEAMQLDIDTLKELETAALMHDIGKIAINENVLNKAGPLTAAEYEEIKRHPEIGYHILKSVDAYTNLADYVLSHHERWDGTGYPRGLSGQEIPLVARIIAVADSFEAMIGERTYRNSMNPTAAAAEIKRCSETQFDPDIVNAFCIIQVKALL